MEIYWTYDNLQSFVQLFPQIFAEECSFDWGNANVAAIRFERNYYEQRTEMIVLIRTISLFLLASN